MKYTQPWTPMDARRMRRKSCPNLLVRMPGASGSVAA